MSREVFVRNVWGAYRELFPRDDRPESTHLDADTVTRALHRVNLWLTPKSIEGFDPADFADLPRKRCDQLRVAVEGFQQAAAKALSGIPETVGEAKEALHQLETILALLQDVLKAGWLAALEGLARDAEAWSRHQEWAVKRDTKRISEELLGAYEAPRLLIHTVDGRLLLDPVTRFPTGAEGLVDLCVMPSYDSAVLVLHAGRWYLHPSRPNGKPQPLSEETFRKAVRQLLQSA